MDSSLQAVVHLPQLIPPHIALGYIYEGKSTSLIAIASVSCYL